MKISTLYIRLNSKTHAALKLLSIHRRGTLNQLCVDFLEAGLMNAETERPEIERKIESLYVEMVSELRRTHEASGLIAILKMDEWLCEVVLIFETGCELPEISSKVYTLNWVEAELPPNILWIQIAQRGMLIWMKPERNKQIAQKMERWGEFAVG